MPLIHPRPALQVLPLFDGHQALVFDGFFTDPDALRAQAAAHAAEFCPAPPATFPGVQLGVPKQLLAELEDFLRLQVRSRLGARRCVEALSWWGLATLRPEQLRPRQWFCHRDFTRHDPSRHRVIASLAYLFDDPGLGGTSIYRPRLPLPEVQRMLDDCQALTPAAFSARWDVPPGYMVGGSRVFEQVCVIEARWNRCVFYDGDLFHSADILAPERLSADPLTGRLTINSFFTCTRSAQ